NHAYSATTADTAIPVDGCQFKAVAACTSGATQPTWVTGGSACTGTTTGDGTCSWTASFGPVVARGWDPTNSSGTHVNVGNTCGASGTSPCLALEFDTIPPSGHGNA